VPEAAVYENGSAMAGKDHVRFARNRLTVEAISEALRVQGVPQC
jgi:hypothetical protein